MSNNYYAMIEVLLVGKFMIQNFVFILISIMCLISWIFLSVPYGYTVYMTYFNF